MAKALSNKKSLEIANIMYANVANLFAMFSNPKYRGDNFSWEWFIEHCRSQADLWIMVHGVRGNKDEINKLAASYAEEIAKKLVHWLKK